MSDNLLNLQAQFAEWQEKISFFKEQEAQIVDLEQKFSARKKIKEAEGKIIEIEKKISEIDDSRLINQETSLQEIKENSEVETLHKALDLFLNLKSKLNYRTTNDDIEEIEKLKSELLNEFIGEYDKKISSIPILKDKSVFNLFESCFAKEKFESFLIDDIQRIRKDYTNYSFFHRNVIVSSITLSLLNYNTLDVKKIDLLIDFLTDFENTVWQKALTGMVLAVLINQNRLERYPELIRRLTSLQELEKVQIGIFIIDKILRNKLFEYVAFPKEIVNNKFLNESPYNWFFPFYINNKAIDIALEKTEQEIEEKSFTNFIINIPLLDCYKYVICKGVETGEIRLLKTEKKSHNYEEKILDNLDLAFSMHPYYNIVSELYLYYKFFPKEKVLDLFNSKITIAETRLKNIILSKTHSLKLIAELHYEKKEYHPCIIKLKELLNLEPNQVSALVQISKCFEKTNQYAEALNYHFQIEKFKPNNEVNLFNIGNCLFETKQYKKSNEYLLKAEILNPKSIDILNLIALNYCLLKEYDLGLIFNKKVLEIEPRNEISLANMASCYSATNQPDDAIRCGLLLCELKPKKASYLIALALNYSEVGQPEKSIELAEDAFIIDSNNPEIIFSYGRLLFVNTNFEKAKMMLNKIFLTKKAKEYYSVAYGNLAHIELFENKYEEAISLYKKCVLEFDNIKEFKEKMLTDLEYAVKHKIKKEDYFRIIDEMINYWTLNKR